MDIYRFYVPILRYFRRKRMRALELSLNISPNTHVLSLMSENHREEGIGYVRGNGLCLPFPDKSFDLVYSDSVIEHVGDWEHQIQFALESRRCGRPYYVQMPYRWFFFEPHLLTPFVHWFPSRGI